MDMLEPSQLFSNSCSKHEVGELHEFPKDLNNELDIELMQQHYIQMLATDFVRGKRASKDRELRSKSRKLFEILSGLLHRIQVDHSITVSDDESNDDRPSDSNRCRDSDLRTLRKANQTLLALLDLSRELKKRKMELKSKKRRQHSKINKSKMSNGEVVSKDVSQVTQYPLNQCIPPQPQTHHQTYAMPNGMIYQQPVMYNTSAEPFYYPTYPEQTGCPSHHEPQIKNVCQTPLANNPYEVRQVSPYQMNYGAMMHHNVGTKHPYGMVQLRG